MNATNASLQVTIGTNANTAPVDRYTASVNAMTGAIKTFLASGGAAAEFGGAFSTGAIGVQKMIGTINEAISGSSELASTMALVERRTGLAGEAFEVLSRTGKISSDELIAASARYRVELGKALEGDKEARALFSSNGLSPEQLNLLPLERQYEQVGAALGRFQDKNVQAAEAQKLFGRGYAAMIPVLDQLGTQGYDKLREKVEQTAGVLGPDMEASLNAAKKAGSAAANELTIALAQTNLRLLQIKATVTHFLADNAGPIQSGGSALAMGFLGAAALSQIIAKVGPQLNVIGSLGAQAFSHGFGVGAQLLPGIIADGLGGAAGISLFAGLGKALATPFGAAFAVAVGGYIINELERAALEKLAARDAESAAGFARLAETRAKITSASSPAAAMDAQVAAARLLSENAVALAALEKKKTDMATAPIRYKRDGEGGMAAQPRETLSPEDETRLANLREETSISAELVTYANSQGAAIAAENGAKQKGLDLAFAESEELKKALLIHDSLTEREKQHNYDGLQSDTAKLAYLEKWKASEQDGWNKKIAATQNSQLKDEYALQMRVKISDLDAKIADVEAHTDKDRAESLAKINSDIDKLFEKIDRDTRNSIQRTLDSNLHQIGVDRAKLDGDFTQTGADKWVQEQQLRQREITATTAAMAKLQAQRDTAKRNGIDTTEDDNHLQGMHDRVDSLNGDSLRAGPDPNNFLQQMQAGLTGLRESMGTTAQQIAHLWTGTADTMRTSLGSAISDMILKGTTLKSAIMNIGGSIVTSFVQTGAQMAANWLFQHTIMAGISRLFNLEDTADHVLSETTKTVVTTNAAGIRTTVRTTETVTATALTGTEVVTHTIGESHKTASTLLGSLTRRGIHLAETIFHGIQVAIRTAAHIGGEILKTAVTVAQTAIRIASVIAESIVYVIQAAVGALAALASIPYVGPILGVAAMAAVLAAGMNLVHREQGGPVTAGQPYIVGEKRPEVFVPHVDGHIIPSIAQATQPAARSSAYAGGGGASGGSGRPVHVYPLMENDRSSRETAERDPISDAHFIRMLKKHRRVLGVRV